MIGLVDIAKDRSETSATRPVHDPTMEILSVNRAALGQDFGLQPEAAIVGDLEAGWLHHHSRHAHHPAVGSR
jgi:hypothetical protein